ncbi:FAD-dependent monooxygenase [Plantactinospora sp. S1510]|uniref:FAD-dependent monooxygenase n=1 Tax=Plantactinospora alkalitolerans TaxID=2789879 RepID=A0ABS0GQN2_9ACTN|nr:FAD-dependent monooxygenase [Plantactinospora alkalitolerans]MBF9128509.1 FAD-dependent monooxygenase [Plantactinospora alkalitolerans]
MDSVLISGASIAGPALAYWLRRHGFAVTVVERAPAPRTGGQAIDIRGVALDVVDRMGILEPLRQVRTQMRGMSMLDGDGNELMRSTEMALSSGRLDGADIEVLREDLTHQLHELTRADVEYVFDDSISRLVEDEHGVRVEFERAAARTFDLVIGADGLHSTVRRLAFGPEAEFVHHLGTYLAIFRTENLLDLADWQIWIRSDTAGGGIYPVRGNTELRVNLGFESEPLDYDHRDIDQQRRLVAERLAGLRWEIPRLLKAMWQAPDFYFDAMAQVRMESWSTGRVALLGDAGYCASPLSGQGTSLALVGAYILADELGAAAGDHRAALRRYEQRMRPFVQLNQELATENPGGPAAEESIERAKNAVVLDR